MIFRDQPPRTRGELVLAWVAWLVSSVAVGAMASLMMFGLGYGLVPTMMLVALTLVALKAVRNEWGREWLGTAPRIVKIKVPLPIPWVDVSKIGEIERIDR